MELFFHHLRARRIAAYVGDGSWIFFVGHEGFHRIVLADKRHPDPPLQDLGGFLDAAVDRGCGFVVVEDSRFVLQGASRFDLLVDSDLEQLIFMTNNSESVDALRMMAQNEMRARGMIRLSHRIGCEEVWGGDGSASYGGPRQSG